ncbi:MAG: patatin-like phospholipase family protein [Desulfarculus sp.]|nr:patatin-like phospholipase family protein [Desulfarculus sp.]
MSRTPAGLTLALGGGGARGFAHVGVLEALHEAGVRVEAIVGTSSGAIAGAGYALGYTPAQMRQRVLEFARSSQAQDPRVKALVAQSEDQVCATLGDRVGRIFCQGRMVKSLLLGSAVFEPEFMRHLVDFFLPDVPLESTVIPFAAVATDVRTGQTLVLEQGPLRQAVLASSSVPGVTPLVEFQGRLLMDGGVAALVPTLEARQRGARRLVAVSVDREIATEDTPRQALELYLRAGDIQGALLSRLVQREADLVVRPSVGAIHWMDFAKAQLIMDLGREAAQEMLPEIEMLLRDGWRHRLSRAWRAGRQALESRAAGGRA